MCACLVSRAFRLFQSRPNIKNYSCVSLYKNRGISLDLEEESPIVLENYYSFELGIYEKMIFFKKKTNFQ